MTPTPSSISSIPACPQCAVDPGVLVGTDAAARAASVPVPSASPTPATESGPVLGSGPGPVVDQVERDAQAIADWLLRYFGPRPSGLTRSGQYAWHGGTADVIARFGEGAWRSSADLAGASSPPSSAVQCRVVALVADASRTRGEGE